MHSLVTEDSMHRVRKGIYGGGGGILVFPAVLDTSSFPEDQLRAGIRKEPGLSRYPCPRLQI